MNGTALLSPLYLIGVFPFVTPWLFGAGAAAAAIPIVIHLFNRRRFRVVPWAAMEFLRVAHRRNFRRLKLERWLLLLLRCLAILLLAAAIAQFTPAGTALAPLLGSSNRLTVVVWNDAYPMAYRPPGSPSVFIRSRRLLTNWLGSAPGGRVAIVRGSIYGRPLLDRPTRDLPLAEKLVHRRHVTQAAVDLKAGLQRALKILRSARARTANRRIWVITDCAAADFGDGDARSTGSPVAASLRRIISAIRGTGAKLRIVDVGDPHAANMALTSLQVTRPVVLVDKSPRLRYGVFNGTTSIQADVRVRFFLDRTPAGEQTIRRIKPGQTRTMEFMLPQPMRSPGNHALEARLGADSLPLDNVRRLVVHAVRRVKLLLVDGEPGDPLQHTLASTAWLRAALSPRRRHNAFQPTSIDSLQLVDEPLRPYRGVILSDIAAPGGRLAARLRRYVQAGGLLMIFPGPGWEATRWNQALGVDRKGILPADMGALIHLSGQGQTGGATVGFDPHRSVNPVTAPFLAAEQSGIHTGLAGVATRQYLALRVPANVGAHVILRFSSGAPAVVRRPVGRGTVVLWATTCDIRWTDFPAEPSWLPFMYELLYHSVPNRDTGRNLLVADAPNISRPGAPGSMATGPAEEWRGPDGMMIHVSSTQDLRTNGRVRLVSPPLWRAGFYGPVHGAPLIAVNVDPHDADIRHVPPARVAALLGLPVRDIREQPVSLAGMMPHQAASGAAGEHLLWLALLVLAAEALLARAFSHYRPASNGAPRG